MDTFDFNNGGASILGGESLNSDTFGRVRPIGDWDTNGYSSANSRTIKNNFVSTHTRGDDIEGFVKNSGSTMPIPNSNKNLYNNDSNTGNTSLEHDHQKQQLLSYSTLQQSQQVIPSTISSQIDFQEINRNTIFPQTHNPQNIPHTQFAKDDLDPGQSQQLRLPTHLDGQNKPQGFEDHHSMSVMEQDHSIDMLLAKELNQLSFRERNEIIEEIHGVSSLYSVDETPQLISRSIQQLQFEINHNIPMYRKIAYDKSKQILKRDLLIRKQQQQPCSVYSSSIEFSPSNSQNDNNHPKLRGYINDPEFLLLFLRRDLFVIRKAALCLVNFMELVYELWGETALTEKTWESQAYLTKFEREVFRTGTMQCLQGRDRTGRRIVGNFAIDNAEFSVQNRLRLSLFVTMAVLEDVETQKKGAVGITMWHKVSIDDFHKRGQCHKRIKEAFPIRLSAIHFCLPHENASSNDSSSPQLLRLLKAMFVMSIGAENRPHMRIHIGSTVECMYALQSFGILTEQIPVNATTGETKTKQHLKWLDLKLQKENALKENKPFNKIECPMMKDVLFGRGWPIMKHPGNVTLRNIIDSKVEEYQNEKTKRGKTLIAYSVVCMVKQNGVGGRFLKEDSGWWVEVSNDMARQKVSIAFRDARKVRSSRSRSDHVKGNDCEPTQVTLVKTDPTSNPSAAKRKEGNMVSRRQFVQQANDSSTSAFLGMDGITGIKRQRCFGSKTKQEQIHSHEENS
eukprot:CAMPEP_0116101906 /NCGR_PEP_ID=MMETSP0327-20121206/13060_1 /TAXON_ID=44447 /ORGANISM="Pseudo-nitzschia delicatissima, Strain B596" /LENGTH=735 /DNA_ID=CAMNT_0003593899 /DNA_START=263 /DNA_END=2470 /DNA_ORIENTATION=-